MMYAFLFKIVKKIKLNVGSLGYLEFDRGLYVYVGSARNSIRRVHRHFEKKKKIHWHIDYLTSRKECVPILAFIIEKDEESKLARYFGKKYKPINGFGSSDTRDISHLFYLGKDL